jgi:pyruvate/2-oxoglutarate dehydrogenase complex dihydrolipoamide acyltransferase (E2) component
MGCNCNQQAQAAIISGETVLLSYLGSNTGAITFDGYLGRTYKAKRGDTLTVAAEDAPKFLRTSQFVLTPQEQAVVEGEASPKADEPAKAPAPPVEIDATEGAVLLAKQNNIDLVTLKGTGANGRITVGDVKAAING